MGWGEPQMLHKHRSWTLLSLCCLGVAPAANAALEVKLHEVNTSVGLAPINATNEWKLETDPSTTPDSADDSTVLPIAGALDNMYDPSQFQLALDPNTNPLITPATPATPNYELGYSVQSIEPFIVTSFDVYDTNGGYYHVADSSNPLFDTVTPENDPNGVEAGIVDNITWELNPSEQNLALPATEDQDFFQLNLVPTENIPTIFPLDYETFGGPGSFFAVGDPNDPSNTTTLTFGGLDPNGLPVVFNPAYLPEPSTLGVLLIGCAGLLARKKR
jgi:hypothetical protein